MTFWEEAPVTELLGIRIYSFGLYCAIGAFCAMAAVCVLTRAVGMKKGTGLLLSCACFIGGILVSRLAFCLLRLVIAEGFPLRAWFRVSSGGWSLFGMITGVFAAAWVCAKICHENSRKFLDTAACALPLAIAAERFAERMFGDFDISRQLACGGFPEGTFLAVQKGTSGDISFLATYLLAAACAILLFIILVFFLTRPNREDGDAWILFMILCGAGGVMLESLRYDSYLEYSFVRFQQVMAAGMLATGVITAGIRNLGMRKGLFRAALISVPVAIALCIGIEFALDRTDMNHYLLYTAMLFILAVPASLGILLLRNRKKGTETL